MNIQTNKYIEHESELFVKAKALIEAGHNYWKQYQKDVGGSAAVVWLECENGHFVLFTRGEYKDSILSAANRECAGQAKLFKPFES